MQIARKITPWLLALVTLLGVVIALYQVLHQRKPVVEVEVLSKSNVVDVNEPLPQIGLYFEGEDIIQSGLTLELISLRIANTGDSDLLQTHYDRDLPWGLDVNAQRVVSVKTVAATSDYLENNIQPSLSGDTTVIFNKVIMEAGTSFVVELLVLAQGNEELEVEAIGKIAGMDAISVHYLTNGRDEQGYVSRVLQGSWVVHIGRALIYVLLFISVLVLFAIVGFQISLLADRVTRKKREKRFDSWITQLSAEQQSIWAVLRDTYIASGRKSIEMVDQVISNKELLASTLKLIEATSLREDALKNPKIQELEGEIELSGETFVDAAIYKYQAQSTLEDLIKAGAVEVKPGQIQVYQGFRDSLRGALVTLP